MSASTYDDDDTLDPSHTVHYLNALAALEQEKTTVLLDVKAEEFLVPFQSSVSSSYSQSVGLNRWHEWRTRYADSYISAWGGLGAVSVWEFWVRLEICGWDPLQPPTRTLDSFDWFKAVHHYSETGSGDVDDADVLPSLVGTAVIPRLVKIITPSSEQEQAAGGIPNLDVERIPVGTSSFNPYSTPLMKRVVDLCEEVGVTMGVYPPVSEPPASKGKEMARSENEAKTNLLYTSISSVFETTVEKERVLLAEFVTTARIANTLDRLESLKRFFDQKMRLLQNMIRWRSFLLSASSPSSGVIDTSIRTFVREVVMKLLNNSCSADTNLRVNYTKDVENVLAPAGLAGLVG
jgi:GC-rich sequence DNA-binding factor